MTLGFEKVIIDTANGPEENCAVVKEVSINGEAGL